MNRKLAKLAAETDKVDFVDVWYPMLDKRKVKQDIFVEDGLKLMGIVGWFGYVMRTCFNEMLVLVGTGTYQERGRVHAAHISL